MGGGGAPGGYDSKIGQKRHVRVCGNDSVSVFDSDLDPSSGLLRLTRQVIFRIYSVNRGIIKAKLSEVTLTGSGRYFLTPTSDQGLSCQPNLVFL